MVEISSDADAELACFAAASTKKLKTLHSPDVVDASGPVRQTGMGPFAPVDYASILQLYEPLGPFP